MRILATTLLVALAAAACGRESSDRSYTLQGQVVSIDAPRKQLTINHQEIKGLMPAMTMPYTVREPKLLDGVAPGDLVNATLVIETNDAYLKTIKKVGTAPLEKPPQDASSLPPARSGFELLKVGEEVPNASFLDQDAKKRTFDSFRGSPVVLTFIYTRCPLPTFCPLMDRHFAAMQQPLKDDAALRAVHLVTVSFDPATDTPAVLKRHARELKADLSRWTFLTGDRDDVDRFAARFGVSIARAMNDPRDITHNLRTAIIGPDGTVKKIYTGNEWTPEDILQELRPSANAD
jgi:protein SCO1/2